MRESFSAKSKWTISGNFAPVIHGPTEELTIGEIDLVCAGLSCHFMSKNYKPSQSSAVSPYLIVDGANTTIEFLKEVFGAVEVRRFSDAKGKLMHGEVRIGDSVIMIADGAPGWLPMQAHVHIYVPDVDATYRRALNAGAISVQEPVKKEDEDKRGGVKDAGGTTWWIATKVE